MRTFIIFLVVLSFNSRANIFNLSETQLLCETRSGLTVLIEQTEQSTYLGTIIYDGDILSTEKLEVETNTNLGITEYATIKSGRGTHMPRWILNYYHSNRTADMQIEVKKILKRINENDLYRFKCNLRSGIVVEDLI
jgi:hypothetical protein